MPSMLMPTLDPKELESGSRPAHGQHWLDMNRALLHSTIQTLEMQRNATSRCSRWRARAAGPSVASTGNVGPIRPPRRAATPAGRPAAGFDPSQWWHALHEQSLASHRQRRSNPLLPIRPLKARPTPCGQSGLQGAASAAEGKSARKPS